MKYDKNLEVDSEVESISKIELLTRDLLQAVVVWKIAVVQKRETGNSSRFSTFQKVMFKKHAELYSYRVMVIYWGKSKQI